MNKKLLLLRHAKSEEISFTKPDFKRNITEKGSNDILKVANYFNSKYSFPNLILCSSANRTMQTAQLFLAEQNVNPNIIYLDNLYHASASELLEIINQYKATFDFIAVIGHNFGISQLADILSTDGCSELPTSGFALFEFQKDYEIYKGNLIEFLHPKNI